MTVLRSHSNPLLDGWHWADGVAMPSLYYRVMRRLCQVVMVSLWRVRVFNRQYEPASGGAVYVCNHQSFLDPMLMGMALRRPMNYMARDTLFHMPLFRRLITSVNAFPVKRGTADLGAMKEAMRRLKSGGQLVVFAEGTRTRDARIGPFLPGVAVLSQRAAQWTVPVLIDGAFEAWPRTQPIPFPGQVIVQYGRPIPREQAAAMSSQEFVDHIRRQLIEIQSQVRARAGRPPLKYD